MRVGIIGADGFVGSHLLRELVAEKHECSVFVERGVSTRAIEDLRDDAPWFSGNVLEPETLDPFLKSCDVVFDLNGADTTWSPNPKTLLRRSVLGVRNVAERCLAHKIDRIVHVSSCITFGASERPVIRNEDSGYNLAHLDVPFAAAKRAAELEMLRWALGRGLPAVIANPAAAIGELDWGPSPAGKPISDICRGLWPVYVDGGSCFIDIRDLTRGLRLTLEKGRVGERYLLCGENLTNKDFMQRVARSAGVPRPKTRVPRVFLRAVAQLGELTSPRLTREPPLLSVGMSQLIGRYIYFDGGKAEEELGFKAGDCRAAIARGVRWHKSRLGAFRKAG